MRASDSLESLVVVGNGMVGLRFVERLLSSEAAARFAITVFGDEPRPAYDRVHLTSYLEGKTADELLLRSQSWYDDNSVDLRLNTPVTELDRQKREIQTADGQRLGYDYLVLATGSAAFVPEIDGIDTDGVFVYRTIEDLDAIAAYADDCATAAVIGGGLLGLEAAKAVLELNLETTVVEFAPRLMPRQLDEVGASMLLRSIQKMGITVLTSRATSAIIGQDRVDGLLFNDNRRLDADMVVISAGIRPRDEFARAAGIEVDERGGVLVDDQLRSSDPRIFAIGEVARHRGTIYGLVGPGYEMAEVAANAIGGGDKAYIGTELSTKLKLLGVDVASFGDTVGEGPGVRSVTFHDEVGRLYKRLNVSRDGKRLLGGILVGDVSDFTVLAQLYSQGARLPQKPSELLLGGGKGGGVGVMDLPNDAQICSCENVTKGQLCQAIAEHGLKTVDDIKAQTGAASGCGGCVPAVTDVLRASLRDCGDDIVEHICEHVPMSRRDLFDVMRVKQLHSFQDIAAHCGTSPAGCELCKPVVASVLASLYGELAFVHGELQDTNDRFMANIQRGGTYSVVPRIPGGEITPERLIALGEIAKDHGLYTKITGAQRIDMFGAPVEQLPTIWERLVGHGFESGHAYGKAVRTVKSCVGSTWCRFGVGDAIGMAIRVENRYKGIRTPHKTKSAVSGCMRECAEAQTKDWGIIASEKGWNLYVCGNGGTRPRHADLLATDLGDDELITLCDRFLMYYIMTADKLQRTSVWLEKMDGGIERLRQVIVENSLGICDELETQMQALVGSYKCEWRELVNNPDKRRLFSHFASDQSGDPDIRFVPERSQKRPSQAPDAAAKAKDILPGGWTKVAKTSEVPADRGVAVSLGGRQIALFNFASMDSWYACDNRCPHQNENVLSRGIIGVASDGSPKLACAMHKRQFSLCTGICHQGDVDPINIYPVRVEGDEVYVNSAPSG